jgi:hypothetical protein
MESSIQLFRYKVRCTLAICVCTNHRIKGLDPNQDTPDEILHIVLLGFVKYMWRDAVSRQNAEGKEILIQLLNSLDVHDLGLAPLRGETLVRYAGSLAGRDFRVIVEVGPLVLQGRIPPEAYEAWLALGRLVPLVFQPEISDLDVYLVSLVMHALLRVAVLTDGLLGSSSARYR